MNIELYIHRIGYKGPVETSHDVLLNLHISHLKTVPFENLDIHNGTGIHLDKLFDKIVNRKRGGFCYELNGLFYELLKEIGFDVKRVSARVHATNNQFSPEFDHMALIVNINEERFLADVGFGEFTFFPLKIELNKEFTDPRGIFLIEDFDEDYKVVKKKNADGNFVPEYIFSEKERSMDEFQERCNYHQTNPESHFMKNCLCSIPTDKGRITFTGNTLKITENGVVSEHTLEPGEFERVLWDYFKIKIEDSVLLNTHGI